MFQSFSWGVITLPGHGGHQVMPSILPEGGTCSREVNEKHQGPPGCCAGQQLEKLPGSCCALSHGPDLHNLSLLSMPLAYSWDQDHGAICAVREGEGYPGPSCSSGMRVQAKEGSCKAWAPGVSPECSQLCCFCFLPSICKLPGKSLIGPGCLRQG